MKRTIILFILQIISAALCSAQVNYTHLNPLALTEHHYIDSPVTISYSISNYLQDTIKSLSISYSVDGGTSVRATVRTFLCQATGGSVVIDHPVPLVLHTAGSYNILLSVDSADGVASATPVGDSISLHTHFYASSVLLRKKVVLEEFTGVWCPYCSGGAYDFETILQSDTDYIGVAAHIASVSNPLNDSMQIPEALAMHDVWSGYPTTMIDRCAFGVNPGRNYGLSNRASVNTISPLVASRKKMASPANVGLSNLVYDSATRHMSVDVTADFLATLTDGDYRVNLSLLEDSVTNPHPGLSGYGWDQNNNYYSHLGAMVYDTIPDLYALPASVVANGLPGGWVHNHVLRKMMGGAKGDTGTIPSHPLAGQSYTRHYAFTLPSTWNVHQLYLLAMVQEYYPLNASYQPQNWSQPDLILNAVKRPLIPRRVSTEVEHWDEDAQVSVYPDPNDGSFRITISPADDLAQLSIVNMAGQMVYEQKIKNGVNDFRLDLPLGIYQLHIFADGHEQNTKMAVLK